MSYHLLILDGKVYAFGSNEFGQCGVGEGGADAILKPTLVNLPQSAGIV
jgi:alpha-tubulin suppressor-like RCC1 family protein